MRLTDLDPRWLTLDGRRVGFMFRCPLPGRRDCWQTCFVESFTRFGRESGEPLAPGKWYRRESQCGIVTACVPEARNWQGCNPDHCWTIAGGIAGASFDTLTVTPSLDGSAAGNWHGFITAGAIVGGV